MYNTGTRFTVVLKNHMRFAEKFVAFGFFAGPWWKTLPPYIMETLFGENFTQEMIPVHPLIYSLAMFGCGSSERFPHTASLRY